MWKTIAALISAIILALVMGACADSRPEVTPPLAPTPISLQVTPTATEPAPPAGATATVAVPATATITPTVSVTVTAEAIVVEVLNIRSGPGIDYPAVGVMPANERVVVVGRSSDGLWLKIQCPASVVALQCWIIGGEQYVQVATAAALPTAPAPPIPPTPAPPPTPTPAPCIASAPAGWIAYQVVSGDTLSGLAGRFGTSVAALMTANCLSGELIRAGSSLYVPASGAGAVATPEDSASFNAGIEAGFKVGGGAPNLGDDPCQPLDLLALPDTTIVLFDSDKQNKTTFTITEHVCIQVHRFDVSKDTKVSVRRPQESEFQPIATLPAGKTVATFTLLPGLPAGDYEVKATQEEVSPWQKTFTVTKVTPPANKIRVLTREVSVGEPVEVIMAGFERGQRVHLYRYNATLREWELLPNRRLPPVLVLPSGEASYAFPTLPEDQGKCFLIHTGFKDGTIFLSDARVFGVKPNPECK